MAKHDTMSAWFWMTNSWLSTGGLLLFLRNPMAQRRGSLLLWLRGCSLPTHTHTPRPPPLPPLSLSRGWSSLHGSPSACASGCLSPNGSARTVTRLARAFKSRHEGASHQNPNTTAQHTLFSFFSPSLSLSLPLPGKVRWRGPSHFQKNPFMNRPVSLT